MSESFSFIVLSFIVLPVTVWRKGSHQLIAATKSWLNVADPDALGSQDRYMKNETGMNDKRKDSMRSSSLWKYCPTGLRGKSVLE